MRHGTNYFALLLHQLLIPQILPLPSSFYDKNNGNKTWPFLNHHSLPLSQTRGGRHKMATILQKTFQINFLEWKLLSEWNVFPMFYVFKWKHFLRYWPIAGKSPVADEFPAHEGQWRGALMFSLILDWINNWVNNREAGELRRHRAHYDVIVMDSDNTLALSRRQVIICNNDVPHYRTLHNIRADNCRFEVNDGLVGSIIVDAYAYIVQCRYNAAVFLQNIHEIHPIAHPPGRVMGCFLCHQLLIDIMPHFLQWYTQYHVILDRVITAIVSVIFYSSLYR